jgi:hypothetical protein
MTNTTVSLPPPEPTNNPSLQPITLTSPDDGRNGTDLPLAASPPGERVRRILDDVDALLARAAFR